jgi:hypothetical protein
MDLIVLIAVTLTFLIAAIAIVMLLVRWHRNHFRFSMRAMLLTCTIIACTLFALLRFVLPLVAHRWAIQQVYESGGAVLFRKDEDKVTSGGSFYSDLDADNPWQDVAFLHAKSDAVALTVAEQLRRLPEADSLYLSAGVSDVGLAAICDAGTQSSMEMIDFCESHITATGLSHLARLPKLRKLFFNTCPINDADLASLKPLTSLRYLTLLEEGPRANASRFSEPGFQDISELKSLEFLWLCQLTVSDAAVSHLKSMTNLKTLRLSRCRISDAAMSELRGALLNCKFEIFGYE